MNANKMPKFDDNTKVAPNIPRFWSLATSDKKIGTILKITPPTIPLRIRDAYK